jgi:SAM-dependent methyltransferase
MIAPRKKLWSTPDSVIEGLIDATPLSASDRVVDIGCGDGRVILQWAAHITRGRQGDEVEFPSFLGVDIDSERIKQAQQLLEKHTSDGTIHKSMQVSFMCANILEQPNLFMNVTVVFLYLIPRGLRIIHSMLRQALTSKCNQKDADVIIQPNLRVVSYMSPLLNEQPNKVLRIDVPHQPGANWPLYFYLLELDSRVNDGQII